MQFTKKVTIIVEDHDLIELIVAALRPKAADSTGKERTLFSVLAHLIGCSDVEAVKAANRKADDHGRPRIKVAEFRRWLPKVLAEVFAEFLDEKQ